MVKQQRGTTAKKNKRGPKRGPAGSGSKPLPAPVEPESLNLPRPEQTLESLEQDEAGASGGLFGFLGLSPKKDPLPNQGRELPAVPVPAAVSENSSNGFSPEAEQILAGIPDTIGGDIGDDDQGGEGPGGGALPAEGLGVAPLPSVVTEAMARGLIVQTGNLLESWRDFEGKYRQWGKDTADAAGVHWAQVLNAAWERYAPLLFKSAESAFPGLTAAVVISAVPLFPIVLADRMRRGGSPVAPGGASARPDGGIPVAEVRRPQRGIVFEESTT